MTACPTCAGSGTRISLEDPHDFLAWLESLPQDQPLPYTEQDEGEPAICYLRSRGAEDATLVYEEEEAGWTPDPQSYQCQGWEREIPGWAFHSAIRWYPNEPAGEMVERFRADMSEHYGESW